MEQISALHILINLGSYEENRTDLNSHRNRGRLADNRTAAVAVSGYVTTALLRTLSAWLSCPGSKALLWFLALVSFFVSSFTLSCSAFSFTFCFAFCFAFYFTFCLLSSFSFFSTSLLPYLSTPFINLCIPIYFLQPAHGAPR